MTQSGAITFYSKTPIEDIEAINNQVSSVLNMENGQLAFSLLMKAFSFEKALMEEHFNEKYIESHRYPKATFRGSIKSFDDLVLTEFPTKATVEGTLKIRKKSKEIITEVILQRQGNKIIGTGEFPIYVADFDIKIPSAVRGNIAKKILVTVYMEYDEM